MIDRRQFVIGGACLTAAAAAEALRPRDRLVLLGQTKIEAALPRAFSGWREVTGVAVLQPRQEGTLSAKLYSEVVTRVYADQETGSGVMLSIAYGDTQSDVLQLHRPEACYPAFGFELSSIERTAVGLSHGAAIPARNLVATMAGRVENVTYWTRVGEYLPASGAEQRLDLLRAKMAGFVPDGILVRASSIGDDHPERFALNRRFLAALVEAVAPDVRPAFVGTALARQLGGAGG